MMARVQQPQQTTSLEMSQLMGAMPLVLQYAANQAQTQQTQACSAANSWRRFGEELGLVWTWKVAFRSSYPCNSCNRAQRLKSRVLELQGYRSWYETFLSWLNPLSEHFVHEVRWAIQEEVELKRGIRRNIQPVVG